MDRVRFNQLRPNFRSGDEVSRNYLLNTLKMSDYEIQELIDDGVFIEAEMTDTTTSELLLEDNQYFITEEIWQYDSNFNNDTE